MRALHRTIRDFVAKHRPDATPVPLTGEELAVVSKHLGGKIPPSYEEFLSEVGAVDWPARIFAAAPIPHLELPSHLVPFAEGAIDGDYWLFDTRRRNARGELPIALYDHEEPELEGGPDEPTPFSEWLKEQIDGAELPDATEAQEAQRRRIRTQLREPRRDYVSRNAIRACFHRIKPPDDYVWFMSEVGPTGYPVELPSPFELQTLTIAARERYPDLPKVILVFAREGEEWEHAYAYFDAKGRVLRTAASGAEPVAFLDYLEARMMDTPHREASEDDAKLEVVSAAASAAERVIAALCEADAIVVEPEREPTVVSALTELIVEHASWERHLYRWLMNMPDIEEVFATEDELRQILARLGKAR